jgi:hypothetical protein
LNLLELLFELFYEGFSQDLWELKILFLFYCFYFIFFPSSHFSTGLDVCENNINQDDVAEIEFESENSDCDSVGSYSSGES